MLKELVNKAEQARPQGMLAHILLIGNEARIGYYDQKTQKMNTVVIAENVGVMPEDDVLDSGQLICELKVEEVSIEPAAALQQAKEAAEKNYPREHPQKWLVLLQNPGKPQYTITGITPSLKTIVFKLDSQGKLLEHSCASLISRER